MPKYGSTPLRSFQDFVYSKGSTFKDFNYSNGMYKTPNHARTPGRDFKDFYYSKGAAAAAAAAPNSPAPRAKSFSGPIRRKPPPEERKLECTLEELFRGCTKELEFTRDVVGKNG